MTHGLVHINGELFSYFNFLSRRILLSSLSTNSKSNFRETEQVDIMKLNYGFMFSGDWHPLVYVDLWHSS